MLNDKIFRSQLLSRRAFLIGVGKIGCLSLLASRMFYIQLIKNDQYRALSDQNQLSLVLIRPIRGKIFDVTNNLLATNQPCFKLVLHKGSNKNYHQELNLVSQMLKFPPELQADIEYRLHRANLHAPFVILEQLSWQQISLIEECRPVLHSIIVDVGHTRFYPMGDILGHLTGYMGPINQQEKQSLAVRNIGNFNVGKSGLEKYHEDDLRGNFGYQKMEVNASGKYIRQLSKINSIAGQNLHLNIDAKLQTQVHQYLNQQSCSAIVMDTSNGRLLILASTPIFDPNNFTKLSQADWHSLVSRPGRPLINKTIQSCYPPGSVFKIITVLAALKAGIPASKIVNCAAGVAALGGNNFRCIRTGHGRIDMSSALKYSCNAYMYEIGRLIGPEPIIEMAKNFGFGQKTMIDLPGEVSGFVPTKAWKEKKFRAQWSIGDTLNLSIGQGFLLATPIQLASFAAIIANNGQSYRPQIVKSEPVGAPICLNLEHLAIVKQAMYNVVNSPGGTAFYSRILDPQCQLAGKTGTVQVQSKVDANDDLNRASIAREQRNHALFLGFAPYQCPRYAIAIFFDHGGGGGSAAAPIASKLMLEVLKKYQ